MGAKAPLFFIYFTKGFFILAVPLHCNLQALSKVISKVCCCTRYIFTSNRRLYFPRYRYRVTSALEIFFNNGLRFQIFPQQYIEVPAPSDPTDISVDKRSPPPQTPPSGGLSENYMVLADRSLNLDKYMVLADRSL